MTITVQELDKTLTQMRAYDVLMARGPVGQVVIHGEPVEVVDTNRTLLEYGEDSTKFVVFKLGDRYFRKEGYYSSWDNGNEFENWDGDLFEVERKEETIPARVVVRFEPKVDKPLTAEAVQALWSYDAFPDDGHWHDLINELAYGEPEYINKAYPAQLAMLGSQFGLDAVVEDRWGGDNHGAHISVVLRIGDRYFERGGMYNSWDTTELDGPVVEVEPYEKKVKRYRRVTK